MLHKSMRENFLIIAIANHFSFQKELLHLIFFKLELISII